MKTTIAAMVAIVFAVTIGDSASGADLSAAPLAYNAPVAALADPWAGFYGGLSLGARWSNPDWTTTSISPAAGTGGSPNSSSANASFDSTSFRVGGYFGYNWHFAPAWVAGVEGDIAWADSSKTVAGIPGTYGPTLAGVGGSLTPGPDSSTVRETWDSSLRGRIGYLLAPRLLLFATGGVSWSQFNATGNCVLLSAVSGVPNGGPWCADPTHASSETISATKVGWTLGAGFETVVAPNLLLRAEYRYADYGTISHTYFAPSQLDNVSADIKIETHMALVGLAYKF